MRVAVTGIGVVSPLGSDLVRAWKRLLQGNHGFVSLESDALPTHLQPLSRHLQLPSTIAAVVPDFETTSEPIISASV